MIWVWRCQANIVSSLQSRGRRSSFSAEHWRKGSRYNKRVGHTRQFPSIRPSAHEKDTVDRRHRSTFKVTKQGKNRADLLAATTQGAKKRLIFFCDECFTDPQTGVASGVTRSRNVRSRYRCSMCPAIHINSRSWLRSSSTHEPSDPPPRVVFSCVYGPISSLATKTRRIGLRLIEGSITAWFAMVRQAKCPTHKGEKEKKKAPRHPGAE